MPLNSREILCFILKCFLYSFGSVIQSVCFFNFMSGESMNIDETINIDWLESLDGLTIEQAVAYLGKFDRNLKLNYNLYSGDLCGVDVTSNFVLTREATKKEQAKKLESAIQARVTRLSEDIEAYKKGIEREKRTLNCEKFVYANGKPLTNKDIVAKKEQATKSITRYESRIKELQDTIKKLV